ncbi:hypothetical protein [Bdellovibrio sp.]|uniref:hypothetical protein n=1 Tax=Bdellovibrio sp. TaxID=28201 RepID=UPI00322166A4
MIAIALFLAFSLPWVQANANSCQSDCELILGIPEVTEDWRQKEYEACMEDCSPSSAPVGFRSQLPGVSATLTPPDKPNENGKTTDKPPETSPQPDTTAESPETEQVISCKEDFDAEVSACEAATLKAANSCDENNSAMSNVANMAAQATLYAGQKGAMGIQESCSKMAAVTKAANAALMSYRVLCSNSITACTTACTRSLTPKCNNGAESVRIAGEARSAMSGNLSSCQGFASKIGQATLAAQNYSQMQMNSQSCALLTSGAPASPEICVSYPDYPGCSSIPKMDCANPEMANHKVCICSKSPNDPICKRQTDNQVDLPSNINPTQRLKPQSHTVSAGDEKKRISITPLPYSSGGGEPPVDGKQGSSAGLGSPNLSPSLVKRLKNKGDGSSPQVLGGFYQGGSNGAEKKYEKLDLSDRPQPNVPRPAAKRAAENGPDLSRFMPGKFNPQGYRGLAGNAERVGIDGITGPHSNIWRKIQNRYKAVQDSLHP